MMNEYLVTMLRSITVIPLLMLVTLLMGKRSIGELPVLDFVIVITIGSVAGADLADPSIEHGPTIFAIFILGLLQIIITYGKIRSRKFSNLITNVPTVIIQNGVVIGENMKTIRFTVNDLFPMLRAKGIFNIDEVAFAILEPTGEMSILKKQQYQPIEKGTVMEEEESLPVLLIVDGKLQQENLYRCNLDKVQILARLKEMGFERVDEVFVAIYEKGKISVSPKKTRIKEQKLKY